MLDLDLSALPERLRVGTSSFSTDDWVGSFYPSGARPRDYLVHYAQRLPTVEIDATFYAIPAPRTVEGWARKAPDGFVIAAKMPRVVTHERYLDGCAGELDEFLRAMDGLGPKLGPILLQFGYVPRGKDANEWATGADFRSRLERFLPLLPSGQRFVVEVRNARWIGAPLLDLLRRHGVGLALTLYYTMPSPAELRSRLDPVTADFLYVRFLGDHREMDRKVAAAIESGGRTGEWSALIEDRSQEMAAVIPVIRDFLSEPRDAFVYFNNHYAGFAPGSIALFTRLWRESAGQLGI